MKPVMQRIVDEGRGDCQTAAIASILDLDYEQVPTWVANAIDENKRTDALVNLPESPIYYQVCPHALMTQWLRERGWHLLDIGWEELRDWRGLVGAYCIASMPSQRYPGVWHAVVGTWRKVGDGHQFEIVHDPSPVNGPYPMSVEPKSVAFLVRLNPAIDR